MDPFWNKIPTDKGERRISFESKTKRAKRIEEHGLQSAYIYFDSDLLPPVGRADFSYNETFKGAVPNGEKMDEYLIKHLMPLGAGKGLIVIDVGGPGRKVVRGVKEIGTRPGNELAFGVRRSLGVVLLNPPHPAEDDLPDSHTVMMANLLEEETEDQIDEWLDGETVDLLVERMGGGLDHMPEDPYWMFNKLSRWYGRLSTGGVMLIQVPVGLNTLFSPWVDLLKKKYGEYLEVGFDFGHENGGVGNQSAFVLRKLPGAPKQLPFLDTKTVRELSLKVNAAWEKAKLESKSEEEEAS